MSDKRVKALTIPVCLYDIQAKALIFHCPNFPSRILVALPEGAYDDYFKFHTKFDESPVQAVRCTPVNFNSSDDRWFVVCVADCFDPPLAIVHAKNESEAEEWFLDTLPWADVEIADHVEKGKDPATWDIPENLVLTSRSTWASTEEIQIHEVYLRRVEL
jgi:hypothetical protein